MSRKGWVTSGQVTGDKADHPDFPDLAAMGCCCLSVSVFSDTAAGGSLSPLLRWSGLLRNVRYVTLCCPVETQDNEDDSQAIQGFIG